MITIQKYDDDILVFVLRYSDEDDFSVLLLAHHKSEYLVDGSE